MKIYFNQAEQMHLDLFGDEGMFVANDNKYYYNGVEFGTNPGGLDEVRIFDTCGRSIPISVEGIEGLVAALQHCEYYLDQINSAKVLTEHAFGDKEFVVIGDSNFSHVEEA